MNIFILDFDPKTCAQYHCNAHVVKMILETAQILSTVIHINSPLDVAGLYHSTHLSHPCTKWAASSIENFSWLYLLGFHLCQEYTYRYDKKHKCEDIIVCAYRAASGAIWPRGLTVCRPQCMPAVYRDEFDCRNAYRSYYLAEKTHLLKYTRRHVPDWIAAVGLGEHK